MHSYFQPLPEAERLPYMCVLWDRAVESWGRDPEPGLGLQDWLCECSFPMGIGMPRTWLPSALFMEGWVMAPGTKMRGRDHKQCLGRG